MLLSSDTSVGIAKSIGLATISFGEVFERLKPDLILVLGDRFEIFAACSAAMVSKIPIAHCHGGEATEGLIDEAIRHSITKMSQVHFTSTEEYRTRVIQLGEQPNNVFNVGALGIENINKLELLNKIQFEESINFKLNKINLLITFHPVTLDTASAETQFKQLLSAIDKLENVTIIFTKPNDIISSVNRSQDIPKPKNWREKISHVLKRLFGLKIQRETHHGIVFGVNQRNPVRTENVGIEMNDILQRLKTKKIRA